MDVCTARRRTDAQSLRENSRTGLQEPSNVCRSSVKRSIVHLKIQWLILNAGEVVVQCVGAELLGDCQMRRAAVRFLAHGQYSLTNSGVYMT